MNGVLAVVDLQNLMDIEQQPIVSYSKPTGT